MLQNVNIPQKCREQHLQQLRCHNYRAQKAELKTKTGQPTPLTEVTKLTTTGAFRKSCSITLTIINTHFASSNVEGTDTSFDDIVETTDSMADVRKDKDHVDISTISK